MSSEFGSVTSIQCLLGNSSSVRLDGALEVLRAWGPCVVLGPRRSVADELVWRLAEEGNSTSAVQRTTPGLLAAELAAQSLAAEGRATVGETAARAVLAQAVETVGEAQHLRWFGEVAELPGFVPSLQKTLQELRLAGVSSSLLKTVAEGSAERGVMGPEASRAHLRLLDGGSVGEALALLGAHSATVLEELAYLLGRYERELQRWGLADGPWVAARAIEVVSRAANGRENGEAGETSGSLAERLLAPWRNLPQLWLDVPLHSVLAGEFFAAASSLASTVVVVAPARDRQTIQAVSRVTKEALTQNSPKPEASGIDLSKLDQSMVEPAFPSSPSSTGTSRLQRVQGSVFASSVGVQDIEQEDDDSFEFFSAAGEGQEAVEIARRIGVLAEEGMLFDEIAILVRQPSVHSPLIEDALSRAGVPGYFARGTARPDPGGRAFLSLLACAEEGLSASRFAEYLSFDQLPDSAGSRVGKGTETTPDFTGASEPTSQEVPWVAPDSNQLVLGSLMAKGKLSEDASLESTSGGVFQRPETSATVDRDSLPQLGQVDDSPLRRPAPAAWERLIVDASVVGGSDRWHRRLKGLASELERHARQLATDDEPRARSLQARRERLEDLRDFGVPIIERLEALPEGGSWAEWLEALEQLAMHGLRWPRSVLTVLAELRPMGAVKNVTLSQVQKILEEPLRSMEAESPKRREGRVFVAPIEQVRGRSFKVVFVPGLAEGVFPARAVEDPLLLDTERRRVAAALSPESCDDHLEGCDAGHEELGLATQSLRFHRERLLLRLAVGAASERLVVSYSRIDVMLGRARVPSFYALDLLRAAEGRIPTLAELEQRAAILGGAAGAGAIWPAPESPEDAIDDAEFDLALLHPQQQEAGAARFLLFANPHLERSLNARARRWRRPFTWADGLVLEDDKKGGDADTTTLSKKLLEEHRPSNRSFSPTALQHFSACPYRFLLQALHRLRPREDRTGFEQLDPLTRGSLFHDTQFHLFAKLREHGLLPVTSNNLARVLDLADAVLDEIAAKTYEEMAPAIDRIWKAEIESLRNDLRGWLRQVSEAPVWRPVAAELAFGLSQFEERDPLSVDHAVDVGGFLLRGSIDLVEVSERQRQVRVTDHKTGRAYGKGSMVIEGGQVLQPVLYALVMEQLLGDDLALEDLGLGPESNFGGESGEGEEGCHPVQDSAVGDGTPEGKESVEGIVTVGSGRLYFCTTRGGYSEVEVPLTPGARKSAEQLFETVDEHIRDGFLPAAPSKDACRFCDYSLVCGPYEERRVQRKHRGRLEALERLRGLR